MSKRLFKTRLFASRLFNGLLFSGDGSPVDNGPYTVEQQRLYTPGTIEANVWPVGTDVQLVYTPGSFKIHIPR